VTLRPCWPAYQVIEGLQASPDLLWLAEHLLVFEIHPWLTTGEVEQIAQTLGKLASWNGAKKDGESGPKNSGGPTASRDPIKQ
jgi:hypothetical protein